MKNFKTLLLSIELHKQCRKLVVPSYLKDQLLRSSSSVALNLSEGKGRRTFKEQKRFFDIAFSDGTPKKAFLTACVVGTILTTINHGDVILVGDFPPLTKVILTYCVPFCVTTWGAYLGKKAKIIQQEKIEELCGR